jgi:hypothetical protein
MGREPVDPATTAATHGVDHDDASPQVNAGLALGIVIPAADVLEGAFVDLGRAEGDVASVLADALVGGATTDIDQLLDGLTDAGAGAASQLGFLANSAATDVSWEIGPAAYLEHHMAYALEPVMFHQDALPAN